MKTEKEIKLRKTEPLYMATIVFQKFKDKKEAYWKGYRDAIKWVLEDSA